MTKEIDEQYHEKMRQVFLSIGPNAAAREGFFRSDEWQRIHDQYLDELGMAH